jgi:thiol-disulfide isomerase/thioredoxin
MKDDLPVRRTLAGAALAGAILLAARGAAHAAPLPVTLADPGTGARVEVAAGPRALHLVFFATWCQPCVDELPRLADLDARFGPQGYQLVLVAVPTRQTREKILKMAQERKPPGRLLFDADGTAEKALGVQMLPTHLVFDREGNTVLRTRSLSDGVEDAIAGLVSKGGRREKPR